MSLTDFLLDIPASQQHIQKNQRPSKGFFCDAFYHENNHNTWTVTIAMAYCTDFEWNSLHVYLQR